MKMFCRKDQKKTFPYIILHVQEFNRSHVHIAKLLLTTFLLCVAAKSCKPTKYRQERQLSVDQSGAYFFLANGSTPKKKKSQDEGKIEIIESIPEVK